MDKFKAPGSDGYGAAFFQYYWNIIKDDVCWAIKSFFEEGKHLKQINYSLIALIPKVNQLATPAQFRPINLCNTVYKIISTIIANRMRPILEKIIDPIRSVFVPNRSIHKNILLAHEIMIKYKNMKERKPG